MDATDTTSLRVGLPGGTSVSALLLQPASPRAALVLAHGAGAGMAHPFMSQLALSLAERHIATLRFQFPYMEAGSRRTDSPAVAQEAVRAAVHEARARLPGIPLFAGGKSFGGRMTSQAQAGSPLPDVRGLVFFRFPLPPAGQPATARAAHLAQVTRPMLFLQGTRDALAELGLVRQVLGGLDALATLHVVDGADHAFHVLARSGRNDGEVMEEIAQAAAVWMDEPDTSGNARPRAS